jgi:hypothetical protein
MNRPIALLRRIALSQHAAALTEFALAMPILLMAGLWGAEAANQAVVQMRVSQVAVLVADNASRVGENSLLGEIKLYESDINDVLIGAHIQAGKTADIYENGRVILSSLEVVPGTKDQQYIHWQRCKGKKEHEPGYGKAGDGLGSHLEGMGPAGEEIVAFEGEAVMFAEIAYDYQPLISDLFASAKTMTATSAFNVRDNRDLSQIYQRDPNAPDQVAHCNIFDSF